ncbi:MAG: hypothetical protein ACLR0U_19885 [Enterocloster clostridioformis]
MNTDYARKNQQIANSFYNLGLEKARIRESVRRGPVPEEEPAF